ncbi:hypothetical protein [Ancylobacter terrae]|uniref:hypothetical protein n=1 Tax=Ancylobacter sp. sgz301288 TaxID=3342077 RepID=UPI00385B7E80
MAAPLIGMADTPRRRGPDRKRRTAASSGLIPEAHAAAASHHANIIPGLVPAIHAFPPGDIITEDVEDRDKPGHDGEAA